MSLYKNPDELLYVANLIRLETDQGVFLARNLRIVNEYLEWLNIWVDQCASMDLNMSAYYLVIYRFFQLRDKISEALLLEEKRT